ncbi:MAG: sortase [Oscillospiraceae bacterium]
MRTNKHGLIEICAGCLLLAAACCIWQQNCANDKHAALSSAALLENAQAYIKVENPTESTELKVEYSFVATEGIIGVLKIPTLSLTLPVQADYGEALLQNAPCRYTTVHEDSSKLIVCGHNYRRQFGRLQRLKHGDEVCFTDMNNNNFRYFVSEITTIAPYDSAAFETGDWDLSLFTCTLDGSRRVLIRCKIIY